jgi:hypothetical protein
VQVHRPTDFLPSAPPPRSLNPSDRSILARGGRTSEHGLPPRQSQTNERADLTPRSIHPPPSAPAFSRARQEYSPSVNQVREPVRAMDVSRSALILPPLVPPIHPSLASHPFKSARCPTKMSSLEIQPADSRESRSSPRPSLSRDRFHIRIGGDAFRRKRRV